MRHSVLIHLVMAPSSGTHDDLVTALGRASQAAELLRCWQTLDDDTRRIFNQRRTTMPYTPKPGTIRGE